ncbi:response regulator [Pararhizobium sp. BT-229]|uniref:response regulator n=1 Tax=Pararhizobium sp. BT-229 TaxID=2986923 RepID=UPI0021F7C5BF|nr:response regulator [Pararhizobium sp. BT-229]MCV9967496.1 response regulator [Pararhizobium sp. BT-229]
MAANQTAIRILIVEDEYLVALYLEDLLTEMGHRVLYSASRINEALHLARTSEIDFAVLDVNLAGTQSFPIADVLRARGIPFVFATGYGTDGLIDGYRHETALRKPYEAAKLAEAIARAVPSITL